MMEGFGVVLVSLSASIFGSIIIILSIDAVVWLMSKKERAKEIYYYNLKHVLRSMIEEK
jgi:hypothetical protein